MRDFILLNLNNNSEKASNKLIFHRILWIPLLKWFSLLGDASPFTNQLEPVRKKLIDIAKLVDIAGESDITEDMHPVGEFFDDTKVQKHNNIPWKLGKEGSSSDVVDGHYTVHKPS